MNTKKFLQIAGIAVLVLAAVFGVIYAVNTSRERAAERSENEEQSGTRGNIPEGAEVPELGADPEDESVAVPVSVTDAAKGIGGSQLRTFLVSAEAGKFMPSTITVYKNDTVHISFTAVDKEYDITVPDYGLYRTAKKGETVPLEFRAEQEGQFVYYCDVCGGAGSGTEGRLIVIPR